MGMKTTYSYGQIWHIAYPILLTLLVQNMIQVINTAFLGRVGEVELGASAIAGIYYMAIFMIAFGFSTGSQILIGRRNGEVRYDKIGEIVVWGAFFLFLLALVMFSFTRTFSKSILEKILSSPNILEASLEYLDWRIWGLFFSCINVMFRAFFVGITRTKVLAFNAILMASVNIILDYALIFGNWGFPKMEIAGAALASVAAEASSVIFFFTYLLFTVDLQKYGFTTYIFKRLKVIKQILNVSFSLMIQYFIALSTWLIFFLAIEKMGEMTLAASNIVRSFYMIISVPIFALGATTNTLVSNSIGAGKHKEVISLMWKISRLSLFILSIFIAFSALFPRLALSIYTPDPELIQAAIPSLYVVLVAIPVLAVGNIFFNAVSGSGNTRSSLFIEIITLILYTFWIWLIAIYLQASLAICWTAELIYGFFIGLFSFIYFKKGKWIKISLE
jgi:putative MATE family efflux protein